MASEQQETGEEPCSHPSEAPIHTLSPSSLLSALDQERQVAYFAYCLRKVPMPYAKLDTNRLTLVHFAVHALDLFGIWQNEAAQLKLRLNKAALIEWIYALQVTSPDIQDYLATQQQQHEEQETTPPLKDDDNDRLPPEWEGLVGFKGGTFLGGSFARTNTTTTNEGHSPPWQYNHGHIAMTYTALCTLRTLGDDLSRVDRRGIVRALSRLQLSDGSFACIAVGSEHDMRFLYCAAAISYLLQDWSGMDMDRACQYICACKSWDGGVALIPGQEGHGGSTFTGIASLVLMNRLDQVLTEDWRHELIHWCVSRQVGGMQGRPNKAEDTCYSYWIGGTLQLLQRHHLLDHRALCDYVFSCQTPMGGFGKLFQAPPDVLHSYYSLAYLSMAAQEQQPDNNSEPTLRTINCTLGIGADAAIGLEPTVP